MEIQQFIEKDYQRIKSLLSNGGLFLSVQNEEKAIQNAVSHIEQASRQLMEQQKNQIDQRFHVKMNAISALLSKLKKASDNIGVLNKDDINRLETALGEMLQILELQKKHELSVNEAIAKAKEEASIADYKSRTEPALEKHFEEAQEKLMQTKNQLNPLEDCYETASFQSTIWDSLSIQSKFPKLKNVRLGEQLIPIYHGSSESYSYEIPEIVPFYTKRSLTVVYKSNERAMLKNVVDNIFLRSLMSAKSGNVLFYFLDPIGKGELFLDYLNFSQSSTKQILNNKIYTNTAEIDELFRKLTIIYDDIEQNYLKGLTIEKYNQKSKVTVPYRVVFVDAFPLGLSGNVMEIIKKLSLYEIGAGLHFVFLVEEGLLGKISEIAQCTTISRVISHEVDVDRIQHVKNAVMDYTDLNYNTSVNAPFEECYNEIKWWEGNCSNFTTVPMGLSKGINYDLEFDEEGKKSIPSAHMVIAGQTGCGKSFLLHSLIMGMSIKYSPDELKFFLIDLKGAEFKQYDTYKLPHAEFIAINGNPEIGLHVLRMVKRKMDERTNEFKAKGVDRLPEYRKMYPDAVMPRYVIVIDEYQRLLESGGPAREARQYIEDIAKVGRALGFNLILSSQEVELDSGTLGNFTHRIAMRCSEYIAHQVLGNTEQNTPDLKVGQAIVHQGSGYDFVQSYFLPARPSGEMDESKNRIDFLKELFQKWSVRVGDNADDHRIIVFDSESLARLENNHVVATMKPQKVKSVRFSPGEKILVDGNDLICQLEVGEKNQNILAFGGKQMVSLRALNGCLTSMLNQLDPSEVRIDIVNAVNRSKKEFYNPIMESSQTIVNRFNKSQYYEMNENLDEWMDGILDEIDERWEKINDEEVYFAPYLVVLYEINNRVEFKQVPIDPSNPNSKYKWTPIDAKLMEILERGSQVGVHCLMHFVDADSYFEVFNEDDKRYFDHRILLQMSDDDSKTFLGNGRKDAARLVDISLREECANNRAIYYNVYSAYYETIKPYEFYNQ